MEDHPLGDAVAGRDLPPGGPEVPAYPIPLPLSGPEPGAEPVPEEDGVPLQPPLPTSEEEWAPDLAHVRLLHAAAGGFPLRAVLANRLLTPRLEVGGLTGSFPVLPGFRTLALSDARSPWVLCCRASLPFAPGERVTLAIIPSGTGLDLVRVDDTVSFSRGTDRACVRAVNLVKGCPGLDLMLEDGRTVFPGMCFKEVTTLRRARPGDYDLYIAQSPASRDTAGMETAEELPAPLTSPGLPGGGLWEAPAAFRLTARPGCTQTLYLMGDWDVSPALRVRAVESY